MPTRTRRIRRARPCRDRRWRPVALLTALGLLATLATPLTAAAQSSSTTTTTTAEAAGPAGALPPPPDAPTTTTTPSTVPSAATSTTEPPAPGLATPSSARPIPDDLWDVPDPVGPGRSYVVWSADPGEPVTGGTSYLYTQADSRISVDAALATSTIGVSIEGDEWWSATLRNDQTEPLTEGYWPGTNVVLGGEGRGCSATEGWVAIDRLEHTGDTVTLLEARAGRSCGNDVWLHTKVRWVSSDPTTPPGPSAPPAGLWDADPLPTDRTYLVIDADPRDTVAGGVDSTSTQADARFEVVLADGRLRAVVDGERRFSMDFAPMLGQPGLPPGYYGNLQRYPFHNPARGGLAVSSSTGCNELTGWFAVDDLLVSDGTVQRATIRFEQVCGNGSSLRGKLNWVASDPTAPPAPLPIPAGLWDVEPAVGAGQSYVAVVGAAGDQQSDGGQHLYTKDVASIRASTAHGRTMVEVRGEEAWSGEFSPAPAIASDLVVGYYPDTQPTYRNPTRPTAAFGDNARVECSDRTGWMVVDEISRDGDGELATLTIRFESRCGDGPPLHGKIRYRADDPTTPPPPAPIPPGLWDVDPGLPAGRTYVAIDDRVYTKADAAVGVLDFRDFLDVGIAGDERATGRLGTTTSIPPLAVGYHANAGSGRNPTRPVVVWRSGSEPLCPDSTGWLVVDELTRDGDALASATLRFEYACPGRPTVHGKVHWVAGDPTEPPGPVRPVPGGLWDARPLDPASSWVHLDGAPGDGITDGTDRTFTAANASFVAAEDDGELAFVLTTDGGRYGGLFLTMSSLDRVEEGFYGGLRGPDDANPAKGAFVWRSLEPPASCAASSAWVAVDRLVRSEGRITELTLRFEQACDGRPPLRGKVNLRSSPPPPPPPPRAPIGVLDAAVGSVGEVMVAGWALDPDTTEPIDVHVYVDGTGVPVRAAGSRPDVGAAYPGMGDRHGFGAVVPATPGPHTVCAYGIDSAGGSNSLLGCRPVVVPGGSPFGSLDVASGQPGSVDVAGWAIDPDTRGPIDVHVYVDGSGVGLTAAGPRPDVGAAYPAHGSAHGYATRIAAAPGPHTVCAYGIDIGVGDNTLLGCRPVVVPGGTPFGSLDVAAGGSGTVTVAGWAIDPDSAAPTQVHVYVDGDGVVLDADGSRPDVAAVFPPYGPRHGFRAIVPAAPGAHQVCAYAINVGVGGNALIECRPVRVT